MTLDAVIDRVAAADTTADRDRLRRTVTDTIAALGLEVHPATREVYNPAEGCYRPPPPPRSTIPQQQNARWSGRRR